MSLVGTRPPTVDQNRVNAGLHVIDPIVLDMSGIDVNEIGKEINGKRIKVDVLQTQIF